jgi:hypothetical protein
MWWKKRSPKPKPARIYFTPPARELPYNYSSAIRLANKARDKAFLRRDEIRAQILDQVERGVRNFGTTPIGLLVDRWCMTDPYWKAAVADNQWYLAQAAAFGVGENSVALRQMQRDLAVAAVRPILLKQRSSSG